MNYFQSGKEKIKHLTPAEAAEACAQGALLVDVREDYMNAFKTFDVPEIIRCPYSKIEHTYQQLPKSRFLIFADAAGIHSKASVEFLTEKGYEKIANMAGGLIEWERDGLPLVINKTERLTGSCMCQLRQREKKQFYQL